MVPHVRAFFALTWARLSHRRTIQARMLNLTVTAEPIRLLALDIDGTLLNPQFEISPPDLAALQRARESGIEVMEIGRAHV